jgi:butyryl-CoA dehydrogenase
MEYGAMARDFCKKRVHPIARKLDEEGIPDDFLAEMAELGYMGCSIPEEYGGMGVDPFSLAQIIEEFARASGGVATLFAAHLSLGCKSIELFGTDKMK